jgi:hypothetical protein
MKPNIIGRVYTFLALVYVFHAAAYLKGIELPHYSSMPPGDHRDTAFLILPMFFLVVFGLVLLVFHLKREGILRKRFLPSAAKALNWQFVPSIASTARTWTDETPPVLPPEGGLISTEQVQMHYEVRRYRWAEGSDLISKSRTVFSTASNPGGFAVDRVDLVYTVPGTFKSHFCLLHEPVKNPPVKPDSKWKHTELFFYGSDRDTAEKVRESILSFVPEKIQQKATIPAEMYRQRKQGSDYPDLIVDEEGLHLSVPIGIMDRSGVPDFGVVAYYEEKVRELATLLATSRSASKKSSGKKSVKKSVAKTSKKKTSKKSKA